MSGMTVITPPTLEPVTLAECRAHCRIDAGTEDALLAGYLIAARTHVEQVLGRHLMTQTVDFKFDDWPMYWDRAYQLSRVRLSLPAPVQSITSVAYIDTNGANQTLDGADYILVKSDPAYVVPAYDVTFPDVRCIPDSVTVRAVIGYGSNPGDVPEPIRQAILLLVASFYENRENSAPSATVAHVAGVDALLSMYKIDSLI